VYTRYTDLSNAYYVLLRNSRTLELKKIVGGVAAEIATLNLPANFDLAAWHTLRIEASGDELTILSNPRSSGLWSLKPNLSMPYSRRWARAAAKRQPHLFANKNDSQYHARQCRLGSTARRRLTGRTASHSRTG
jgi:hypothetical protein